MPEMAVKLISGVVETYRDDFGERENSPSYEIAMAAACATSIARE